MLKNKRKGWREGGTEGGREGGREGVNRELRVRHWTHAMLEVSHPTLAVGVQKILRNF